MYLNGAGRRVLTVDDERIIADTLAMILYQHGWESTATYSGEQAVLAAAELSPYAVVSDVIMDGMNGIEAALLIIHFVPDCKIILFSGDPAATLLLDLAEMKGNSFEVLAKPVHPNTILALLNSDGPPEDG